MLTLAKALKDEALADFIAQEEARGVGPIDRAEFDALTAALVKAPLSKDQTSHSASDDCSSGKKTPQGSGPYVAR